MQHETSTPIMDFETPLSTIHLKNALANMCATSATVSAKVLAWNCVPQYTKYFPTIYIVNEDDSYSSGSHWTVLYYPSETSIIEYFDSFGRAPRKELIRNRVCIYNRMVLQNIFSSICGHYCLLFVWYRVNVGFSLDQFINMVSSKTEKEIYDESRKHFFTPTVGI